MRLNNLGLCIIVVLSLVAVTGSGQMGYSTQQSGYSTQQSGYSTQQSEYSTQKSVSMNDGVTETSGESLSMTSAVNETSGGDNLNPSSISNGPYPNFPWYSSGGSPFYSQGVPVTTFSPFREYYTTSGTPVVGGIISNPVRFDIAQKTPSTIYYGTGQALPYSQYVSTVPSKTNDLWIQGATSWSQYVVSPVGTWLQLVANTPVAGTAGFYEVVQTDTTTQKYSTYQFNQGYNTMNFNADQVGRHMLYFVVNNQPSNVVIVDVLAQAQPA